MTGKKTGILITVAMAIVSFACLAAAYLAATDIWHGIGSPDFWQNQGQSALEWRILACTVPVIAILHIAFFAAATVIMTKWPKD
jgi:hypothetical protein